MKTQLFIPIALLSLTVIACNHLQAQQTVLWDESVNGPITEPGAATVPMQMGTLNLGTNSVFGSVNTTYVFGLLRPDADIFRFSVPTGSRLTGTRLTASRPLKASLLATNFARVAGGSMNTEYPWRGTVEAGDYIIMIEDGVDDRAPAAAYQFDMLVTAVPEAGPSLAVVSVAGGQLKMTWPTNQGAFRLEIQTDCSTNWTDSGISADMEADHYTALVPTASCQRFFRLAK